MDTNTELRTRTLERVIPALDTSDGAGVKLRRSIGRSPEMRVDPFLMLDEFSSENPDDYVAGFPPHPHRGFETVTYMLDGHMRHEDHLGNRGELRSGGVQWMTAGRGIIHSEMPQQERGRMRGFQLWINLPAAEKMQPPAYRDVQPADIPVVTLADGVRVKVIAGSLQCGDSTTTGPIRGGSTAPLYFDVELPVGGVFRHPVAASHNTFIYVYEGTGAVGPAGAERRLAPRAAGVLSAGEQCEIRAADGGARFILLAARPLGEPVAQYGPFVMNTHDEIRQAIADYQAGRFGERAAAR
ncbi:MAG: pirin family protein [Betaproteobacteria bacterium]|nr:MAG: pirin family protein [Betaproteobacteria bacterium]